MNHIRTKQLKIATIKLPDPDYGDIKLNVYPFKHNGSYIKLPKLFEAYEGTLNEIMSYVPISDPDSHFYVTIDSKFFTKTETLRREGIHIDGNFCGDLKFKKPTWGGITVENNKIVKSFETETPVDVPLGTYVSSDLGGTILVSNAVGCRAWFGEFIGEVGAQGDFSALEDQLTDDKEYTLEADEVWLVSSDTPHESLPVRAGTRRSFMRITLPHDYENDLIFNEKEQLPDKWYLITHKQISGNFKDIWDESTLFVNSNDFNSIARSMKHTHKRYHYIMIHRDNLESFPMYIQEAWRNRQTYHELNYEGI